MTETAAMFMAFTVKISSVEATKLNYFTCMYHIYLSFLINYWGNARINIRNSAKNYIYNNTETEYPSYNIS